MNILQGLQDDTQFFVSLNQEDLITEESRHGNYHFSHPTYDANRAAAQKKHSACIRRKGISLCGAYWGYGFHEDGLTSGLRVCESFGESLS
jgi:predicted NAD/FAD-binding protein